MFWKERGGTPYGLDPVFAPIPVTSGMLLWLRFAEELVGGTDDGGCHFRPSEVRGLLDEGDTQEELLAWMDGFFGEPVPLSTARRYAKRLLRDLGSGRAAARNEMMTDRKSSAGVSPMAKVDKLDSEVTKLDTKTGS